MIQGAPLWCTGITQRDGMGREVEGGSGCGTHVHPCRIQVNVWQWCTGMTQRDGMGRGGGRGDQDAEHMYTHAGFKSTYGKTNTIL